MSFILTCILIYLLFVLFRPLLGWATRKFFQYQARRIFGAYGAPGSTSRSGGRRRHTDTETKRRKKKVFERGYGEYVEFEDITEERADNADTDNVRYVREEQVSDAEWIEIK